jgi:CheY-like chemotaxis protein
MLEHAQGRIVVVADEATIRQMFDAVLRRRGYEVATAANGEEALGWLMLRGFDLVLVDVKLPGMSGLELARRAQRCQPSLKVLLLTSSDDGSSVPVEEYVALAGDLLETAALEAVPERAPAVVGLHDRHDWRRDLADRHFAAPVRVGLARERLR